MNSTLLAYLMHKPQLVPRLTAVWGWTAARRSSRPSTAVLLGLYEQTSVGGMAIALPIFAWEVSLAVWMIATASRQPTLSSEERRTGSLNLAPA